MPNWCYNSVIFSGTEEKLEEVSNLIQALKKRSEMEGKGVLPEFIEEDKDLMSENDILYMFYIDHSEDIPESLTFSSRWVPALDTIHKISEKIGVSFEHFYEESGNMVYGVAGYNHGTGEYFDIFLEDDDFEKIEYHENHDDIDYYSFEGKDYEVQEEILEILLERKRREHLSR